MPKTPMDEDDFTLGWKDEIGSAWQVSSVKAKAVTERVGHPANHRLRFRILRPDFRHRRAFCGIDGLHVRINSHIESSLCGRRVFEIAIATCPQMDWRVD